MSTYKNGKSNGKSNGQSEKGEMPWVSGFVALGEDENGNQVVRRDAEKHFLKDASGKFTDQRLAIWKRDGQHGPMYSGKLGENGDAIAVTLSPMLGIFERSVVKDEAGDPVLDEDGKPSYRTGRDLLGTVQIVRTAEKTFPVVQLIQTDGDGNVTMERLVSFLNESASATSSTAAPKDQPAPPKSVPSAPKGSGKPVRYGARR